MLLKLNSFCNNAQKEQLEEILYFKINRNEIHHPLFYELYSRLSNPIVFQKEPKQKVVYHIRTSLRKINKNISEGTYRFKSKRVLKLSKNTIYDITFYRPEDTTLSRYLNLSSLGIIFYTSSHLIKVEINLDIQLQNWNLRSFDKICEDYRIYDYIANNLHTDNFLSFYEYDWKEYEHVRYLYQNLVQSSSKLSLEEIFNRFYADFNLDYRKYAQRKKEMRQKEKATINKEYFDDKIIQLERYIKFSPEFTNLRKKIVVNLNSFKIISYLYINYGWTIDLLNYDLLDIFIGNISDEYINIFYITSDVYDYIRYTKVPIQFLSSGLRRKLILSDTEYISSKTYQDIYNDLFDFLSSYFPHRVALNFPKEKSPDFYNRYTYYFRICHEDIPENVIEEMHSHFSKIIEKYIENDET